MFRVVIVPPRAVQKPRIAARQVRGSPFFGVPTRVRHVRLSRPVYVAVQIRTQHWLEKHASKSADLARKILNYLLEETGEVGPHGSALARPAAHLFHHLVGDRNKVLWNSEAECLCCLEIDGKLKLGRQLHR